MKKIIRTIMVLCLLLCFTPQHLSAKEEEQPFANNAKGAYVMEYSSGSEVFKKNENEKLYPASMTKMMSLILFYEAMDAHVMDLKDTVRTSAYAASMGGSQVFLEENEEMSVEQLLKAICIASANDATVALAEKVAGNETAFVKKMNQKAKELQLKNTNFVNTTGLHDDKHYSSAKDMAIIAKHLIDVGGNDLLAITSTYEDYIREDSEKKFWLVNTNKLIRQYEGVDGLKTGYTSQAKSCISVTAKKNNMRFIAVVMGEPDTKVRNEEVKQLLDYSFSLFDQVLLYPADKTIDEKKLTDAKEKSVQLKCEEDISIVYEKGKDVSIQSQEIEWLNKKLPYKKNDRIAKLKLELNDGSKLTSYLVASKDIHELSFLDIFIKAMQFSI